LAREDEGGRESREGESVCDAREGGGDVRIRFRAGAGRRGSAVERRAPSTTARERGGGVLSEEETGGGLCARAIRWSGRSEGGFCKNGARTPKSSRRE
jgi:hypothetical protein